MKDGLNGIVAGQVEGSVQGSVEGRITGWVRYRGDKSAMDVSKEAFEDLVKGKVNDWYNAMDGGRIKRWVR